MAGSTTIKRLDVKVTANMRDYDSKMASVGAKESAAQKRVDAARSTGTRKWLTEEMYAAGKARQYELQLLNKKWASERAAAKAVYAEELNDIISNAAAEESIKERLRLADLKHEAELHAIQQRRITELGQGLKNVGGKMTMGVTLPGLMIGGASAKLAMDYGDTMAKITGLTGTAAAETERLSGQTKKLAAEVAKSPKELGDALYFTASAGIKGDEAMKVLIASAKASAAGLGETKVIVDAVTSAVNAYAKSGLTAAKATDVMVAAVREGKAEPEELAGSLGRVLPIASQMGISFENVAASIAIMSRSGLDSAESTTALRATLASLLRPTDQTQKALASVGLTAEDVRKELSQNLIGGLSHLAAAFKNNDEALGQVFPNIRALTGVLNLTGQDAAAVAGVFDRVAKSTGDTEKAFSVMSKTAGFDTRQAFAELQTAAIDLGNASVPVIRSLTSVVKDLSKWFEHLSPRSKDLAVKIGLVAIAAGPLLSVAGNLVSIFPKVATGIKAVGTASAVSTLKMQGLATAEIEAKTASLGLGASLKAIALNPFTWALAAATAGVIALRMSIARTYSEIDRLQSSASKLSETAQANNKKHMGAVLGAASTVNLQNRVRYINQQIDAAAERKTEAQGKAKWWKYGSAMARSQVIEETAEISRLRKERAAIRAELDKRMESPSVLNNPMSTATPSSGLSDEDIKARDRLIASTSKANELARRDLSLMGIANKYQQERTKAWFDYNNEKNKVLTLVKEAKDKYKLDIDVSDQLTGLAAQYTSAVQKINEEESQARREELISNNYAKLNLMALQEKNEYQSQRIQERANLLQTLGQLEKSKASELQFKLAIAQSNKRMNEIDQQEAEQQKFAAETTKQNAEAAKDHALAVRREMADIAATAAEDYGELTGDKKGGQLKALAIKIGIQREELNREREKADTPEEKQAVAMKEKALLLDSYKKKFDILTGGAQAFADKVRDYKDKEVQAWQDRMNAAERYFNYIKGQIGIKSLDSIWENAVVSTAQAQLKMPMLPAVPSPNVSSQDVQVVWDQMQTETANQTSVLSGLLSDIRNILARIENDENI
jgi:TP901 family phage tail tape measure protein